MISSKSHSPLRTSLLALGLILSGWLSQPALAQGCRPRSPTPVLTCLRSKDSSLGTRYVLGVSNWNDIPGQLFELDSTLPGCGLNKVSPRTWVDVHDQDGNRIQGFCGFNTPENLKEFGIIIRDDDEIPACVTVTLRDRRCGVDYVSNCIGIDPVCKLQLPNPEIEFNGIAPKTGGPTRYWISVLNRGDFPDALFERSPNLPPCGVNENASRTWVEVFDQDDQKISGFCSIDSASELERIWFVPPGGSSVPTCVYIVMVDRRCGLEYRSNCISIPPSMDGSFIRGDCNNDGRVNIADPSFLANWLFGIQPATSPVCLDAADTNGDGSVNIADPTFLANTLVGIPTAFPMPDPTPYCNFPEEYKLGCEGPTICD